MVKKVNKRKIKKGFTLVELLAAIVILAVILIIAVPNIIKIIDKSKTDAYNNQMTLIKNAASKYVVQYNDELSNPNNTVVTIEKLIEKQLLPSNIKNPITNQPLTNISITISKINNEYVYGVSEGPELLTGMIPVYYDSMDSKWKKSDITNTNNNWYDYSTQKWANAVTVTSTNRATYQTASIGTEIPMTDINTMFVYIPRYKYKIPSGSGVRNIDIIFETKYTTKSSGDAINTYYTHPSFTFGTTELNGIWVGKFEITGSITNSTTAAITILPDLPSVRGKTIKTFFEAVKNTMQSNNSTYGFASDSDAHVIKNTEWGAVTYLSNSIYGKYGNSAYSGANKEIYINNNQGYYTGCSAGTYNVGQSATTAVCDNASNGYKYNYTNNNYGIGASTTGTIYGIYDMHGGAYDNVMALYNPTTMANPSTIRDCSGYSNTYTPGSCPFPFSSPFNSRYENFNISNKYYDRYLTPLTAMLGDATTETSTWNGDGAIFNSLPDAVGPWLVRGGYINSGPMEGIFSYSSTSVVMPGDSDSRVSVHIVITPGI